MPDLSDTVAKCRMGTAKKFYTSIASLSHIIKVLRIQTEGTQKRREAEAELGRIEGELKQKLLALRT